MKKSPDLNAALAEVKSRQAKAQAKLQGMYEQLQALKMEGSEIEKSLFAMEGEIKALTTLGAK